MRLAVKTFVFCAVLLVGTVFVSAVFKPAALTRQSFPTYLDEPKNSLDVLFFGTSHVYSAIDPRIIDKGTGTRSYVLSGSGQSMALTYYTIREALQTQTPRVIAVESFRIIGEQRMADNNAMANFHYMPWSWNKVRALFDATNAPKREAIALPLVAYHSRWSSIGRNDFGIVRRQKGTGKLVSKDKANPTLRGYSEVKHVANVKPLPPTLASIDQAAWDRNYPWLARIAALCDERDIKLVLFWTPNAMEGQSTYIGAIQAAFEIGYPDIACLDFNPLIPELGLDYSKDFADDTHTNVAGATKVSHYMGEWLAQNTIR